MSTLYGRTLDPLSDPYSSRPMPLGRAGPVHDLALARDSFSPWRGSVAAEPPGPPMTFRDRMARLWGADLFAEPDQPDRPTRATPAHSSAPTPDPPNPGRGVRLTMLDVVRRLGQKPPWA